MFDPVDLRILEYCRNLCHVFGSTDFIRGAVNKLCGTIKSLQLSMAILECLREQLPDF